jgi:SCY1-like protein 2
MSPEFALDELITASSDLYALGCVIYAVHLGGRPPFQNHNSLQTLRKNADRLARGEIGTASAVAKLGGDLRGPSCHSGMKADA